MKRVGKGLHFFATCMVAAGTLMSTFWILSANSWMQTPQGHAWQAEEFIPVGWWAIIFNPSFPYRLVHVVLAAYLTTAFVVGAVSAYHLLRDRTNPAARIGFSMAMFMAAFVAPVQILAGDMHGLNTLEHQPAKIAAMEGHWETQNGAPLILFALPDMAAEENLFEIALPKLGSLILTHDLDGEIKGLKNWPAEDRPNVPIVFWSFRLMVGIGFLMALIGLISLFYRWRMELYDKAWFHRVVVLMGPSGFVAVIAGWVVTEVGRQPYLVYGLLRTADLRSPIEAPAVAASLTAFVIVYFAVFGAGFFYTFRLMKRPPALDEPELAAGEPHRAASVTPVASIRPAQGD